MAPLSPPLPVVHVWHHPPPPAHLDVPRHSYSYDSILLFIISSRHVPRARPRNECASVVPCHLCAVAWVTKTTSLGTAVVTNVFFPLSASTPFPSAQRMLLLLSENNQTTVREYEKIRRGMDTELLGDKAPLSFSRQQQQQGRPIGGCLAPETPGAQRARAMRRPSVSTSSPQGRDAVVYPPTHACDTSPTAGSASSALTTRRRR